MDSIHRNQPDAQSQVELRHIRYFLALARELHYGRAADQLFISQSGLSKQIMQLEKLVGARLFDRNKKVVNLTPSGQFLKERLSNFQGQLNCIFEQLSLVAQGIEGEIKLGFVGSAITDVVPDLMLKAKDHFPGIVFSLYHMPNQLQIEKLLSNEIDIGLSRIANPPPELDKVLVQEDTFSLVVPANHPLKRVKDEDVSEILRQEDFIFFDPNYSPDYHATVLSICNTLGFQPKRRHNSGHPYTIFRLVDAGLGICIAPTSLKKGFNLDIKFIELDHLPQRAKLYAVWNKSNTNPCFSKIKGIITQI